jgi:hypothetical protein
VRERRQLSELGAPFARVLRQLARVQLQRQAGPVGDDQVAVAVEDLAPRSADPVGPRAVVLRFGEILFPVDHLQQPEAGEQHREEHNGEAPEDRDPQGQPIAHRRFPLIAAAVHQVLLEA